MSKDIKLKEFIEDDLWFPSAFGPDKTIQFTQCTEESFVESAFLDNRIKATTGAKASLLYNELRRIMPEDMAGNIGHIFHISHVGSTLAARVIGELGYIRVLREPAVLRDLVRKYQEIPQGTSTIELSDLNEITADLIKLLGRGKQSKTVIKHTSGNNLILDKILYSEDVSAVGLYTSLKDFVCHAYASNGAKADIYASLPARVGYLNKHAHFQRLDVADMDIWDMAACLWLCEMHKLCLAELRYPEFRMINFDQQMEDRSFFLSSLLDGLGITLVEELRARLLRSDIWGINAKISNRDFGFDNRRVKIQTTHRQNQFYVNRVTDFVWNFCDQNPGFVPLIRYIDG